MVRLYVGLVRDGKWFNYVNMEEILGGGLAVLDGADKSGAARLLNLIRHAVKTLSTSNGEEYILQEKDYLALKHEDCWKIGLECMKQFTGLNNPKFEEYFYCKVCSRQGLERYTKVEESWFDLIEKGWVDEHFLDNPEEISYWTELPVGIEIEGGRAYQGGHYTRIRRESLSIGALISLASIQEAQQSEAHTLYHTWDAQITEIDGMSERDFNSLVKRNQRDSFTKKYLMHNDDLEAMANEENQSKIGIDASFRPVQCENCHTNIGGYLDFSNFFQLLLPRKSSQNTIRI